MKLRKARIVEGVVEIEQGGKWVTASDVVKMSQGDADSDGHVLVGGVIALYVVNTQPDLQELYDKVADLAGMVADLGATLIPTGAPVDPLNLTTSLDAEELATELSITELK